MELNKKILNLSQGTVINTEPELPPVPQDIQETIMKSEPFIAEYRARSEQPVQVDWCLLCGSWKPTGTKIGHTAMGEFRTVKCRNCQSVINLFPPGLAGHLMRMVAQQTNQQIKAYMKGRDRTE